MLDLSKAFDSVNHRYLFTKLIELNFPANLIKLLASWYANQQINIRWKMIVTDNFHMCNGTRQGSILSPYLFTIYMRDVSNAVVKSGLGCHIGNMPCNILLYADDIVLISPSWHAQQALLNLCCESTSALFMKFNVAKSATVIFPPYKGSKRVTYMFPSFALDGCPIIVVDNCKYLGHFLSSKDDDDVDILHQNRLLYARTNLLIRKFGRCSKEVKLCLFKAYCMNFYGESLWECYSTTVLKLTV